MRVRIGAFDPDGVLDGLDVEHLFANGEYASQALTAIDRVMVKAGRALLLTVEPRSGLGAIRPRMWAGALGQAPGTVYVRFAHEFNGRGWYPWQVGGAEFRRAWEGFAGAMPANVRMVWAPNVSYPGSAPIVDFWPDPTTVHVVGLSGYARNGETPAELFRPTLDEARALPGAAGVPVWIAETAAPRGRKQARYAEALVAFAAQQGIEAVLWFNENKAHLVSDERDWTLTPVAAGRFLGAAVRPPTRRRREGR